MNQPRVWVFASLIVVLAAIDVVRGGFPGYSDPAHRYTSTAESHRVKTLPGWGKLDLNLFAGYLAAGKERSFFYAFVEAANHPRDAPVLLWLTGGPGCSSISSAFMGEHGPFFPRPGTSDQLIKNPYSYHNFAHVIYVDSPAFVGFSYSNDTDDHYMGDERMAEQNLQFLKSWRAAYPQLAQNKFWLAGESYAGHYVVALAENILEANSKLKESGDSEAINFHGFLLGNPSTDPKYDNEGRVAYWHSHGLISEDVKQEMEKTCNFSNVVFGPSDVVHLDQPGSKCEKAINDVRHQQGLVSYLKK
jgi:serine carboxypeptidase-like clade 2